jgi:hypothetical protein
MEDYSHVGSLLALQHPKTNQLGVLIEPTEKWKIYAIN